MCGGPRRVEPSRRGSAIQVAKWVERFGAEGVDGLRDRSLRPLSSPNQTSPAASAAIENLRRQRRTGKQIAAEVSIGVELWL